MLTKDDLVAIRKLVREEVGNESQAIQDELGSELNSARMRIQTDVRELQDRVKNLEIRTARMHKDLKKEIKQVSHFQDVENLKTLKRVEKIESHLGLHP